MPQSSPKRPLSSSAVRTALKVAGIYVVLSALWILCSGYLLHHLRLGEDVAARWEAYKGLLFVVVTAVALFFTVRYYVASIHRWHAALRASQAAELQALRTRAQILNALRAHVALLDRAGNIIVANHAWTQTVPILTLHPPGFDTGANYIAICESITDQRAPYAHTAAEAVRAVLAGRHPHFAMEYPTPMGDQPHWFRLEITPLTSDPGLGVVLVRMDITERKRAEDALQQTQAHLEQRVAQRTAELSATNAQLTEQIAQRQLIETQLHRAKLAAEAANHAKSSFLANTSHEIRTPLTAILGYTDLLLDSPPDTSRQYAQIIRENAAHLLTLIEDLLDLSRVEAGKLNLTRIACDPAQIAAQVYELLHRRARDKGLSLTVEHRDPLPSAIHTDPTRLRQILLNLVGNAIKFTRAGAIRLVVQLETAPPVSPAAPPFLRFDVIDTGIGMSREQCQRAFEPFYQVDASAARRHGGTGLGLAISQQLARMLGGSLTVASTSGQGSTFTLRLEAPPLPPDTALAPGTEAFPLAPESPLAGRILLAEDHANIRRLVTLYLEHAGATVTAVDNGRAALQQTAESQQRGVPFDLIILDMQMPELDGAQAATALRHAGYTSPILALTAHTLASDRETYLAAGCNDLVGKPIDRAKFLHVLRQYLSPDQADLTTR